MTQPDPLGSRAVLIGTGEYHSERLPSLPGVPNNVADLAVVLSDFSRWGLPPENCQEIIDPDDPAEVITSLIRAADATEDTLIVYFAGHGLLDSDGDLVLATRNTAPDRAQYSGVPYEWVREVLERSQVMRRVVILDCCFSGRALRAMSDTATAVIGQIDVEGTYVLTSAPSNSTARAPEGSRNTTFTAGLLNVLREGIPGSARFLSLDDVYEQTLRALARGGQPRPQRLGTNTIGRLPLVRNGSWQRAFIQPPSVHYDWPSQGDELARGIRDSAAAVAPMLGHRNEDSVRFLDRRLRLWKGGCRTGGELVLEAMKTMRQQYGDGAAMTAVITGVMIDTLESSRSSSAAQSKSSASIEQAADWMRHHLAGGIERLPTELEFSQGVCIALGDHEITKMIAAAAVTAGPSNLEVATSDGTDSMLSFMGKLTIDTTILAPNMCSGPITMHRPWVVVSTDGHLDTRALVKVAGTSLPSLLIISPDFSIAAQRSLLHAFTEIVVVRPTSSSDDLHALSTKLADSDSGTTVARVVERVLITASATTIIGIADDAESTRGRIIVRVAGPEQGSQLALAVRALAITRSIADAGVVAGGGAALFWVSREVGHTNIESEWVRRLFAEPLRQIIRNAGHDPDDVCRQIVNSGDPAVGFDLRTRRVTSMPRVGVLDSVATIRGAIGHATATMSRYLTML